MSDWDFQFSQTYSIPFEETYQVTSPIDQTNYNTPLFKFKGTEPLPQVITFYEVKEARDYIKKHRLTGEIHVSSRILNFIRFDVRRNFPSLTVKFYPQ